MGFILILMTLLLAIGDAARRSTTPATEHNPQDSQLLGRRGSHPGNVWDLIELQKLDNPDLWTKNPTSATKTPESADSIKLIGRQSYPGQTNPDSSNELPGPIVTSKPTTTAQPPPGCLESRGQFPSSKSCANYLNCWDGVVIEQTCPDGLLFNSVSLVCDYDYNVNCGNRPVPTPKPPMQNGTQLCPDPNGRYRSATNCSEFYVCVFGKPVKFSCPRGLVYNDLLGVCDYPYNVDCKGAATPKPTTTTSQSTSSTTQPTQTSQTTQGSSNPSYPNPNPNPSYPSNPSYPGSGNSYQNPWLSRLDPESWQQRVAESPSDFDEEDDDDERELSSGQQHPRSPQPELQSQNPWNLIQNVPASLATVPCENGDLHRLNHACTNVVVCRNGRPQLVQCSSGLAFDRSSDVCQPISVAKC
ncbi:uncharacterized protein LOC117218688 [Megalopta genalis]|uniref:uncharacterized protein LOC117218688 n=1 Tax=Megalopta genalis TaxID=115081 RepID=UPI003FD53A96